MLAELNTLRIAYEEESMSPEQIAEDRDLDLSAVKSGLMQCSPQYRKDCGHEEIETDRLNFSDDELQRVNSVIVDIALSAEDDHTRLKAAMYIRDDKKGRRDIVKGQQGGQFNILFINERMRQVRQMATGVKQKILSATSNSNLPINV
jgi:hypothetical protein